jgi:hypothetical protein
LAAQQNVTKVISLAVENLATPMLELINHALLFNKTASGDLFDFIQLKELTAMKSG